MVLFGSELKSDSVVFTKKNPSHLSAQGFLISFNSPVTRH
jgi:hypothetical protein